MHRCKINAVPQAASVAGKNNEMRELFRDRIEADQLLAGKLIKYGDTPDTLDFHPVWWGFSESCFFLPG